MRRFLFFLFFGLGNFVSGQSSFRTIAWLPPAKHRITETKTLTFLSFKDASYDAGYGKLPLYYEQVPLTGSGYSTAQVEIKNMSFTPLTDGEIALIGENEIQHIRNEITVNSSIGAARGELFTLVSFIPFRKNQTNGKIEKLISFELIINPVTANAKKAQFNTWASHSVLASGDWFRVGVQSDGIYKLSYSLLQGLGMDVNAIDPRNLRIYGNGGGMLPLPNSTPRKDDLFENPVWVSGESDGVFNTEDYVLFYAKGPDTWTYSSSESYFNHQKNLYTAKAYYFVTADLGPGKRISSQPSLSATPTNTVTTFNDYGYYENNKVNFFKSGREWYGEDFEYVSSYTFDFSFPDIDNTVAHYLKADVRARSLTPTSFSVYLNGTDVMTLAPPKLTAIDFDDCYASRATDLEPFSASGSNLQATISFTKGSTSSVSSGWINYISLNVRRRLNFSGAQMGFRDVQSADTGNIAEYIISSAGADMRIWDITDPVNPFEQLWNPDGANARFIAGADSLRQYIAFRNSGALTPTSEGTITNQDLHGLSADGQKQPDLLIITPAVFLTEAQRLADHHRNFDGMNVAVIITDQIYNEFSSGAQDVAALRDFIKMFYDRAQGNPSYYPKYVQLFGDGSYDPLDRLPNNTNYIITYQSANSDCPLQNYTTDDFFACLDYTEGGNELASALVDIGIGRLTVNTLEQAKQIVDKIIHYATDPATMRDWRNYTCFIADDEDNNLHIDQADQLATLVDTSYDKYNVDKIYLDAFQQVSSSGGQRYPDVEEAILKRVEKGTLLMNWTGHGGEVGWAHERILEVDDITAMTNWNNLPVFFTATCEFARYDDPARTSAGEYLLINPRGGAAAALFTTRLAFANENFVLNKNFYYQTVFDDFNGDFPKLGDVVRITKVKSGSSPNLRNFHLLGDPAMRLAYPVHDVITTAINGTSADTITDTVKALSKVTVTGYLRDKYSSSEMTGFNGVLYMTVFDKAQTLTTLVNDPYSKLKNFSLQKNVIYKGKASVKNGDFSFTFMVPKDISYKPGSGRISYYAENGTTDASGYFENFIIGGTADTVLNDMACPDIRLYMNDENFVSGGLTDANPVIYIKLWDENGINTVGNGIGHDLLATLDGSSATAIVLNDYYESDMDSYQSGTVRYQLSGLSEGRHTLKVKAWDILNNSCEVEIEFVVAGGEDLALSHVLNYPNPFSTLTSFMFEHNKPGQELDVQVQLFTVTGKLIKTIDANIISTGYRVPANVIVWNGRDDYGDKIGMGVYIYRLRVATLDGGYADKIEKLVLLN